MVPGWICFESMARTLVEVKEECSSRLSKEMLIMDAVCVTYSTGLERAGEPRMQHPKAAEFNETWM